MPDLGALSQSSLGLILGRVVKPAALLSVYVEAWWAQTEDEKVKEN